MKHFIKIITIAVAFSVQFATAQRIKINDKAPTFTAIDVSGTKIDLEKYKGKKVFLAFFRYASCPVCNFRMHDILENHDQIKANGYEIIAVYESTNETLNEFLKDENVPFPIIGDSELVLYKKYRVEKSFWRTIGSVFDKKVANNKSKGKELFKGKKLKKDGNLTRIPADFLIDENGIITTAYYGTDIGDHLPLDQIIK
ncbi:MAG: peroxiredoxin family protein [Flavobacterium sp.]|uniref:peroxiredoxin family protein n=1 Tax=Flavobacterium sp. TaxID=239 RepID=UPI0022BE08D9|nr:peroxiredoxin family protein [Flavobacterium sp.]MCZ8196579.1 peroxiredoxin family protein [Flavobacterium sp.]